MGAAFHARKYRLASVKQALLDRVRDDAKAPVRRQAMLDVLDAYFTETNAGRTLADRSSYGPSRTRNAAGSARAWVLSQWTLTGPPATWRSSPAPSP